MRRLTFDEDIDVKTDSSSDNSEDGAAAPMADGMEPRQRSEGRVQEESEQELAESDQVWCSDVHVWGRYRRFAESISE